VRSIMVLAGLAAAAIGLPATAATSTLTIPPATAVGMRIVIVHNQARSIAGVGPIYWDVSLAAAADRYAAELARSGRWGHSQPATRPGQGENLWMGTRGAFSVEQMVGSWAGEGRWFKRGVFPNVSRTGNWDQVGHYTQIVWRGTTRVGCSLRSSAMNDYLVCRYSPAGNVFGVAIP
jgi:hypothetical protein